MQTGMQASLTRADRLFRAGRKREGMALLEKTVANLRQFRNALANPRPADSRKDYEGRKGAAPCLGIRPNESATHFQIGSVLLAQNLAGRPENVFGARPNVAAYQPAYYSSAMLTRDGRNAEASQLPLRNPP